MRPQQRREIGCGMNVAGPLPQNPEVGQRGNHLHQMAGILRQHRKIRGECEAGRVAFDLATADNLATRGLM